MARKFGLSEDRPRMCVTPFMNPTSFGALAALFCILLDIFSKLWTSYVLFMSLFYANCIII